MQINILIFKIITNCVFSCAGLFSQMALKYLLDSADKDLFKEALEQKKEFSD